MSLLAGSTSWRDVTQWQRDGAQAVNEEVNGCPPPGTMLLGRCVVCETDLRVALAGTPEDLREGLACARCGANARQRAAALVLFDALEGRRDAKVYATEQATPFYVALKQRLPRLHGSEFVRNPMRRLRLSQWLWRHGRPEWLSFEDLTNLSMQAASCDAIVSLDVLEHIPDHRVALRECARVLRPGAPLVLTVPFHDTRPANRQRASMRGDGTIEHHAEPEYHGDPVSGGVLCFHDFGWALLDDLRDAGFADVWAYRVRSTEAVIPFALWVLSARR